MRASPQRGLSFLGRTEHLGGSRGGKGLSPFCRPWSVHYFLSLLWILPDASGCSLPGIHTTTFPSATPWSGQVLALYDVQCCICECGQGMETRWRFIYRQAAEESTANTHSRFSFSPKENEVTMFSAKWMEMEIVLLSRMDHTDTNAVFSSGI